MRQLGVRTIHLHTPGPKSRTPERAKEFSLRLKALGLTVTCVFAGFAGESYASIPAVRETVGLVPATTRGARLQELKEIADFAKLLQVKVLGLHIGFVPHAADDPTYRDAVEVARAACDHCAANGQSLLLETGQEPADVLLRFLADVERENLFVNFDPANIILYGVGEPLSALERLGGSVHSVHCKDARWSDQPGETWGTEVSLGEGDVDIAAFLRILERIGYAGPLTIERAIPQEPARQKAEIGGAVQLLEHLKQEVAG